MRMTLQKRLAASILGCSEKRVVFEPSRLEDIKEAITKTDIRLLVGEGVIKPRPKQGVSRARANKRKIQKSKGLRKGEGRRKGKATARESKKDAWMKKIRAQRKFIVLLRNKELIKPVVYKELYLKSKGGFFRSVNHIKLFLTERKLFLKSKKPAAKPAIKSIAKTKHPKATAQTAKHPSKKKSG